jgi:hypothetical protein
VELCAPGPRERAPPREASPSSVLCFSAMLRQEPTPQRYSGRSLCGPSAVELQRQERALSPATSLWSPPWISEQERCRRAMRWRARKSCWKAESCRCSWQLRHCGEPQPVAWVRKRSWVGRGAGVWSRPSRPPRRGPGVRSRPSRPPRRGPDVRSRPSRPPRRGAGVWSRPSRPPRRGRGVWSRCDAPLPVRRSRSIRASVPCA